MILPALNDVNSIDHLKEWAKQCDTRNERVINELLKANIEFAESTFHHVFLNSRRVGRTTVKQLQIVKKALLLESGQRRLFFAIDHQWRWASHCNLAEITEELLKKIARIKCKRYGPLLSVYVVNKFYEPGGDSHKG